MIVTRTALPRRTVLRGLGAALALPLLDSMIPALTASSRTAASGPVRLGVVYAPNGIEMSSWTPATAGTDFALSPTLRPLEPYRDRLLVLGGLNSNPNTKGQQEGTHPNKSTRFLTGVPPAYAQNSKLQAGVSMDQIAARELGRHTQLASLELGLEGADFAGSCENGFSCAYNYTIAWRGPNTPLPMEHNPRAVFERLFGDSETSDPRARAARARQRRSLLDSVTGELARMNRALGPSDRVKLAEYADAVRDVERRIQRAEEQGHTELPAIVQPAGIPATFAEHAALMFDLWLLAYQTDLTRVVTFMWGHELSGRTYPEIGVPDAHHPLSHHNNRPENLAKLARLNHYQMTLFARFVEKLRATPDGDGTLLDRVMLVYGAGMSDSETHSPYNLPVAVVGGGGEQLRGGRHLVSPKGTPLTNLHLSLLDKLGVPFDQVGDSTGRLAALADETLAPLAGV